MLPRGAHRAKTDHTSVAFTLHRSMLPIMAFVSTPSHPAALPAPCAACALAPVPPPPCTKPSPSQIGCAELLWVDHLGMFVRLHPHGLNQYPSHIHNPHSHPPRCR